MRLKIQLKHKIFLLLTLVFMIVGGLFLTIGQPVQALDENALWGVNGANEISNSAGLNNTDPRLVVARVIRICFGFLGILSLGLILYAGYTWMMSAGQAEKISKAKKIMTSAVIGLLLMISSFAVASYVMTKLVEVGGGGTGTGTTDPGTVIIPGTTNSFYITSTSPINDAIDVPRNVVAKLYFNQVVKNNNLDGNIQVKVNAMSINVDLNAVNSEIEIKPQVACPAPNEALMCWEKNSVINVAVTGDSPTGVVSLDGLTLNCAMGATCNFKFNVGDKVDLENPKINEFKVNGVCAGVSSSLSANLSDDDQVADAKFYVNPDTNFFATETNTTANPWEVTTNWNGASYTVGQSVDFKLKATDRTNKFTETSKTAKLLPAYCCNSIQDTADGEQGVDCGGACNTCGGGSCNSNDDCYDGPCVNGVCKTMPKIDRITPEGGFCNNDTTVFCLKNSDCSGSTCNTTTPNGAEGNFITIQGRGFGSAVGEVYFTNNQTNPTGFARAKLANDATTGNPECGNNVWSNNQIIVVVPGDAFNSKILVKTADKLEVISSNSWMKTPIKRPGLCKINKVSGKMNETVPYLGVNLSLANAYYGNLNESVNALEPIFANPNEGEAKVPNLNPGLTSTFVKTVANVPSNFLNFNKEDEPYAGPTITSIEPAAGAAGQYITIRGSGFGDTKDVSSVSFNSIEANYEFPIICADSVWSDNQIIVKVPAGLSDVIKTIILKVTTKLGTAKADKNFSFKTGEPDSSLCKIEPALGQVGQTVNLYGEYFGAYSASDSAVGFYNNISQRGNGNWWLLDNEAQGMAKPYKATVLVPLGAQTGLVKVVNGAKESNSLNFKVGSCLQNNECGGTNVCCATGTPEAGHCQTSGDLCYGKTDSCVFEWDFSTENLNLCPGNQTLCNGQCCAGTCTNNKCNPFEACSGYNINMCLGTQTCPNSPGNCSTTPANHIVDTGVACNDNYCDTNYPNSKSIYNKLSDRCEIDSAYKCADKLITSTKTFELVCKVYNAKPRWHINESGSCPVGYKKIAGNQCVDETSNCFICDVSDFACSTDGATCASVNKVCPAGSSCNNKEQCIGAKPAECDCCCRKDQAAQDCCAGLGCEGSCGAGDVNLGNCSGCTVSGDQEASNEKCNCTGHTGKYCDMAAANGSGQCKDCAQLITANDCSKNTTCCWDNKSGQCSGVNSPNGNRDIFEDAGLRYCAYYNCDNLKTPKTCKSNEKLKTGEFDKLTNCISDCKDQPVKCNPKEVLGEDEEEVLELKTLDPFEKLKEEKGELDCSQYSGKCLANQVCNATTCSCEDKVTPPGSSCSKPNNTCNLNTCGTGYACLGQPSAYTAAPCNCCCDASLVGTANDKCKNIPDAFGKLGKLGCVADKGNCTDPVEKKRGLCCGCSEDGDCGDKTITGCGVDVCCHGRPEITKMIPDPRDSNNQCLNTEISVEFDQKMLSSSFPGNIYVIGAYDTVCPAGTSLLAKGETVPESWFGRLVYSFNKKLVALIPSLGNHVALAGFNYCAVLGTVSSTDLGTGENIKTKASFTLKNFLSPDKDYYVVLKGDENLDSTTGILSSQEIGLNGNNISGVNSFNGLIFNKAKIWKFHTGKERCSLASVKVTPESYLFQKTGQEMLFMRQGLDKNQKPIVPIGSDDWSWNAWSIDTADTVATISAGDSLDTTKVKAGNIKDKTFKLTAKAVSMVNQVPQTYANSADLRVFLCANPWPSLIDPISWKPWRDLATNMEFYYCRDAGGVGTADDLPAVDPATGTNANDIYFFRSSKQALPDISNLSIDASTVAYAGGRVNISWNTPPNPVAPEKYKIYYGEVSKSYNKIKEIKPIANTATIEGLTNNKKYYFAVTAFFLDKNGNEIESDYSVEKSIEVKDMVKPNLVCPSENMMIGGDIQSCVKIATQDKAISLDWNKSGLKFVPINTNDVVSYEVGYGSVNNNYAVIKKVGNSTNLKVSNLLNDHGYYFGLRATDAFGNIGAWHSIGSIKIESCKTKEGVVNLCKFDEFCCNSGCNGDQDGTCQNNGTACSQVSCL